MVNTAALEHVGDELGRDGGTRLVLLVLPGVGKVRKLTRVELIGAADERGRVSQRLPSCKGCSGSPSLAGAGSLPAVTHNGSDAPSARNLAGVAHDDCLHERGIRRRVGGRRGAARGEYGGAVASVTRVNPS